MKRGTAAIIILVAILCIGLTVNYALPDKAQTLKTHALAAADSRTALTGLEEEWHKQKIFFLIFVEHAGIEAIDKNICALSYADDNNYRFLCLQTASALALLADEMSLSFGNVF